MQALKEQNETLEKKERDSLQIKTSVLTKDLKQATNALSGEETLKPQLVALREENEKLDMSLIQV